MTTDESLVRLFAQVANAMTQMSEAMDRIDTAIAELRRGRKRNGKEPRVMVDTAPLPRQGNERYLARLKQRPPLLSPSYKENEDHD